MKCANCDNTATYRVNDPGANPVEYCTTCLPRNLAKRAAAGDFALPAEKSQKVLAKDPSPLSG